MSHKNQSLEIEWECVLTHKPDRERVTLKSASQFEKKIAASILQAQPTPKHRIQWASFFAGGQNTVLDVFSLKQETMEDIRSTTSRLDDVHWDVKQTIENDDIVSSLYRLRVPFSIFLIQDIDKDTGTELMVRLADTTEQLEELPPEPTQVIQSGRESGPTKIKRFIGMPTDSSYNPEYKIEEQTQLLDAWETALSRDLTTHEQKTFEYTIPYTPPPTVSGYQNAMAFGEPRLDNAESFADTVGVDLYSNPQK